MSFDVDVLIEWDPNPPIKLKFDKQTTAGEVVQKLLDDKVFNKDQFKYAHIYGHQKHDKIVDKQILLSNDPTSKRPRFSIWNWIFPIYFWISLSVPFLLRKLHYSKDICALSLVGITGLQAFIAYKLHTEAIFYPKRTTNSLNKYEMCFILFFISLSPTIGEDDISDMSQSDSSSD